MNSAMAARLGTEGLTQSFDADYEQVWNAALGALEDKTIETGNKDIGQITTKAEKSTNLLGDKSTTYSIKITRAKPVKVIIHVNIEKTVSVGLSGRSSTDTYSDDDEEKAVMKKIEGALASAPKTKTEEKKK